MFEGLKQWRTKRQIAKTAQQSLADHQGIAATTWPLTATATPAERAAVAAAAQQWLADQLPHTATPHGLGRYHVVVAYSHGRGPTRTCLAQDPFTPFDRRDTPMMLQHVHDHLLARDLTTVAAMTTLELYLVSYGDLLKPLYDHD